MAQPIKFKEMKEKNTAPQNAPYLMSLICIMCQTFIDYVYNTHSGSGNT